MKIYLHGRKGQLHSWTTSEYISNEFIYQRSLLGHDYMVKKIKLDGEDKDRFLDEFGQLKLCTNRLHSANGKEVIMFMLDDETYDVTEQIGMLCAQFVDLSSLIKSMDIDDDDLNDAVASIQLSVDLFESLYDYEIENMCNTLRVARDVMNKKYREF